MKLGFHSPPALTLQGENQSCFIRPEDREGDAHLLYMVYVAMWNELAAANWAHFALTLSSLRGEPITTSPSEQGQNN